MPLKKGLTENCWSNWVFMGVYKADLRQWTSRPRSG
jgi:hypothetical protein